MVKSDRREFVRGLGAVVGATVCATGCRYLGRGPETVAYVGGKIYTADKDQPQATAMVVRNGRFVYVGSDAVAREIAGASADIVDLKGRRVVPGFVDTHVHALFFSAQVGSGAHEVGLELSHEEVLSLVRKVAAADEGAADEPLFFWGFGEACRPFAIELDRLGIDRPIVLVSFDGHVGWANARALALAKVTKDTPDFVPGLSYYERDADGSPNGHLVEGATYDLISRLRIFSEEGVRSGYSEFVRLFAANGFTTCFDAGLLGVCDELAFGVVAECDEPMRVYASVVGTALDNPSELASRLHMYRAKYESENFHVATLKMFKDGTFEAGTALTYRAYPGAVGGTGCDMISSEKMLELAKACAADGFNVHVHAIGARAVNETLGVFKTLGRIAGTKTVAHAENVDARGRRLFAESPDVFMSTTAAWFGTDPEYVRVKSAVMGGAEVLHACYPIGTVRRGGSTVVFGSDLPVSTDDAQSHSAIVNIDMAVNRGAREGLLEDRNESFTVAQAIDAYTVDAARMLRGENEFGTVSIGKSADFVVLDRDILSVDPREIASVQVAETYFRGECVYRSERGAKASRAVPSTSVLV